MSRLLFSDFLVSCMHVTGVVLDSRNQVSVVVTQLAQIIITPPSITSTVRTFIVFELISELQTQAAAAACDAAGRDAGAFRRRLCGRGAESTAVGATTHRASGRRCPCAGRT